MCAILSVPYQKFEVYLTKKYIENLIINAILYVADLLLTVCTVLIKFEKSE